MRRLAALALLAAIAACGGSHPKAAATPPPTTVPPPYTRAQVLRWVSTTLGNGIDQVRALPAGDPYGDLVRASQSLSTASEVSIEELGQTSWDGQSARDEMALVVTLSRIRMLVAAGPAVGFGQVDAEIQTVSRQLQSLMKSGLAQGDRP